MKTQAGFTLIELLITVAVAGTMLAIALPSYQNTIKNNCLTNNVNSLVTSLQFARSEATKRRASVSVTAGIPNAGNTAIDVTNWGLGWTVYWDDPAFNVTDNVWDPGEEIRIVALSCQTTTIVETGGNTTLLYRPTGFIDAVGTFDVCDNRTGETGRQLTISITGRPNMNAGFVCS